MDENGNVVNGIPGVVLSPDETVIEISDIDGTSGIML